MILIIGGAYQGKLAYTKEHYALQDDEILDCSTIPEGDIPTLTHRCIYHYEAYIERCLAAGRTPQTKFANNQIIIADDVSCGVVPIDTHLRAWREACGRAITSLALEAQEVTRIFCGIPLQLK